MKNSIIKTYNVPDTVKGFVMPGRLYNVEVNGSKISISPVALSRDDIIRITSNWMLCNVPASGVRFQWVNNVCICIFDNSAHDDVKIGKARCRKSDVFIGVLGRALAYSRASGKELPDDVKEYLGID